MLIKRNVKSICLLLLLASSVLSDIALANEKGHLSITTDRRKESIVLSVKSVSPHKVFTLPSPDRLVVDLPAIGSRPNTDMPDEYKGKLIKRVRFGQFDPHTWRLVFDLNQTVRVLGESHNNGRFTIDIAEALESQAKDNSSSSNAESNNSSQNWPTGSGKKIAEEDFRSKSDRIANNERSEKKSTESKASKSKSGKPMIVIDPGHGGIDPGTKGPGGSHEKDIVLDYARELRAKLLKSGRYNVMLTRDEDDIVVLRKRVEIARKAGAKMFISLHADSAPEDDVRGLSVYTVSEKASDQETEALATRENKADILTGMDLSDEREDVAGILISLAERDTKNRSATLADILVTSLDGKVQLLSNTHRFAGFAVLKAPDVPSVLVEIGFLSHPKEEKLINSKAYRDKVTSGIASGIDSYFKLEKRMGEL